MFIFICEKQPILLLPSLAKIHRKPHLPNYIAGFALVTSSPKINISLENFAFQKHFSNYTTQRKKENPEKLGG